MAEAMSIFKLMRVVRDARSTRNSDRLLLTALVLRCNPTKKYSCWPSYRQLALDTMLDEVTLKRAAKRLEDVGLIKRVVRENRSNLFFLNAQKLIEQAAEIEASTKTGEIVESPFEQPEVESGDDETDGQEPYWEGGVE